LWGKIELYCSNAFLNKTVLNIEIKTLKLKTLIHQSDCNMEAQDLEFLALNVVIQDIFNHTEYLKTSI